MILDENIHFGISIYQTTLWSHVELFSQSLLDFAVLLSEHLVELLEFLSVHLSKHLSDFGHILLIVSVNLSPEVLDDCVALLVVCGDLGKTHVDAWVGGHLGDLFV